MIETTSLTVTGMKCGGCENIVSAKLKTLDGVKFVEASSKNNAVKVEFDSAKTGLQDIAQAIKDVGYMVVDDN